MERNNLNTSNMNRIGRHKSPKSNKKINKKFNQTSLVRNKDYTCIGDDISNPCIFSDRNYNTAQSTKNKNKGRRGSDPGNIRTVEIDVGEIKTEDNLSLNKLKNIFEDSKGFMKEAMKNYFIFLEFFK